MNLYIQIENGQTVNHPAFEDNLLQAFGSIPSNWEPFTRVERPTPSIYQVLDSEEPTYQNVNGVWTDVWDLRDMTDAEKAAKQQAVKDAWAANPNASNFTAWTFDESICAYVPPIPRPTDGKIYTWQGITNSWIVVSATPSN
jgi:hypothetical protein